MGAFITSCACAPLTKKSVTFATLILSLLHPTIHIPYNPWSDQHSFAKSRLLFTTLAQLPLTHLKTVSHATLQTHRQHGCYQGSLRPGPRRRHHCRPCRAASRGWRRSRPPRRFSRMGGRPCQLQLEMGLGSSSRPVF